MADRRQFPAGGAPCCRRPWQQAVRGWPERAQRKSACRRFATSCSTIATRKRLRWRARCNASFPRPNARRSHVPMAAAIAAAVAAGTAGRLAGMTTAQGLFVLETLAADHRMRVVYRGEQGALQFARALAEYSARDATRAQARRGRATPGTQCVAIGRSCAGSSRRAPHRPDNKTIRGGSPWRYFHQASAQRDSPLPSPSSPRRWGRTGCSPAMKTYTLIGTTFRTSRINRTS